MEDFYVSYCVEQKSCERRERRKEGEKGAGASVAINASGVSDKEANEF